MFKVKYYKDSQLTVQAYAHKRMFNIFGMATPVDQVAKYFKLDLSLAKAWQNLGYIPDEEEAIKIIESITKEKAEDFIVEKNQAIDFITNTIH